MCFILGEDVDFYKQGKITGYEGEWMAYENGDRPDMLMPGNPVIGMKYFQGLAPKKAMDRAEVMSVSEIYKTLAGEFKVCLKTSPKYLKFNSAMFGEKRFLPPKCTEFDRVSPKDLSYVVVLVQVSMRSTHEKSETFSENSPISRLKNYQNFERCFFSGQRSKRHTPPVSD